MLKPWVIKMNNKSKELLWYEIKLKQVNPLHIGIKNYGVLSETRLYIPGWTMWGALVNTYGKMEGETEEAFAKGKQLFEKITCFFPCISSDIFPKFKKGNLYMGELSEKDFRMEYTDIFMSTAINPHSLSAKDKSLHETEIILPKSKDEKKENVFWKGLIGMEVEDEEEFNQFKKRLKKVYVGGEITYGFGEMEILSIVQIQEENNLQKWGLKRDGSIYLDKNIDVLRNYMCISDSALSISGKTELIVQYDFSKSPCEITSKNYCFVPGSKVTLNNYSTFFVLNKGVFIN